MYKDLPAYVINLPRRPDRLEAFKKRIGNRLGTDLYVFPAYDGMQLNPKIPLKQQIFPEHFDSAFSYEVDKGWRDPFHRRRLTRGEIGCFLSHYALWQMAAKENKHILILEDDVEIVKDFDNLDVYFDKHAVCTDMIENDLDILFLGRKYMEPPGDRINDRIERPKYTYWACAYALSPKGAKALISMARTVGIIPVDELIPAVYGENPHVYRGKGACSAGSYINPLMNPIVGAFDDSETETPDKIWKDFDVHVVTVATDPSRAASLMKSAEKYGVKNVINLAENVKEWRGGNVAAGRGGGQKIQLLRTFLKSLNSDHDVVLFLDGYDTEFVDDLDTIVDRYLSFKKEIVFGAEANCWPSTHKARFDALNDMETYRYLNSGCFIGTSGRILDLTSHFNGSAEDDDQEYYQSQFLSGIFNAALDYEQYIFHNIANMEDDHEYVKRNGQTLVKSTRCYTCVLHYNGPEAKRLMVSPVTVREEKIPESLQLLNKDSSSTIKFIRGDYYTIPGDFIIMPFLSEDDCKKLIAKSEAHGKFEPLPGDEFPAQEIRLKELDPDLFQELEEYFAEHVQKVVNEVFKPLHLKGVRDAFVMRYTMDTQTNLALHHDASLVTGSVKLNDDYTGAELIFPRQRLSNYILPVGHILLFPGQVTHPHYVNELKSGSKYSFTVWTRRLKNDL